MSMSKISRFTKKAVRLAKNAVGGRGEVAAPEGGGGFADYAVVSLHCLRIYLAKPYRDALDLLSEMPQILGEIGLDAADLPDHSTLVKAFDRIQMAVWRVLLRLSAQLTIPPVTPRGTRRFSTANTPANTTAAERITASRRSKRPRSPIWRHKLSLTCTVRPRNVMTRNSAGNSPAATRASCTASPPTKATIGSNYARSSGKKA